MDGVVTRKFIDSENPDLGSHFFINYVTFRRDITFLIISTTISEPTELGQVTFKTPLHSCVRYENTLLRTHWRRLWCWEGLGAGGEGDDRGWDGWMHHRLYGHESEWTLGVGDGQGGLACCDSWGRKESDTTERLNWTELNWKQASTAKLKAMKRETWDEVTAFLSWV